MKPSHILLRDQAVGQGSPKSKPCWTFFSEKDLFTTIAEPFGRIRSGEALPGDRSQFKAKGHRSSK